MSVSPKEEMSQRRNCDTTVCLEQQMYKKTIITFIILMDFFVLFSCLGIMVQPKKKKVGEYQEKAVSSVLHCDEGTQECD